MSSIPKQLSKTLSIVYPFEPLLWPIVFGTTLAITIILQLVIYAQNKITPNHGTSIPAGFCMFALIGENQRDEACISHPLPIRILLGTWILSCFLFSAGYAGNLRGFLLNPGTEPAIDSLQRVIDSGKPATWPNFLPSLPIGHPNPLVREAMDYTLRLKTSQAEYLKNVRRLLHETYKGERIYIHSYVNLEFIFKALYTSPDGKLAFDTHFTKEVPGFFITMAYQKIGFTDQALNRMTHRAIESGLLKSWEKDATLVVANKLRMKLEASGEVPSVDFDPPITSAPLSVIDLQAPFGLCLLMMMFSIGAFIIEMIVGRKL